MDKQREILQRRVLAFRAIVQAPTWPNAFQGMLAYANQAQDHNVRAGRFDMIGHLIRVADSGSNVLTEESTNGG